MKRAVGFVVLLALLGGAVWFGLRSNGIMIDNRRGSVFVDDDAADDPAPPDVGTPPIATELDCDGGDAMVTNIDGAATYATADEALAGSVEDLGSDPEPADFVAVEQGRNATTYAYAIDAETKITISAERFEGKWAISTIEECASNEG